MKRLFSMIAILCVVAMAVTLAGCGSSKKEDTTTEAVTTAAETTEAETEETTEAETEETTEAETEEATEAEIEETTEAAEEDATEAAAVSADADIVIEYGDFDGIVSLASDAQNFKVEEGTTVKISGVLSTTFSNPAIQEADPDNSGYKGITMYVDGDWETPADGTDIEILGTFVKGQYYMELHVNPEDITVK